MTDMQVAQPWRFCRHGTRRPHSSQEGKKAWDIVQGFNSLSPRVILRAHPTTKRVGHVRDVPSSPPYLFILPFITLQLALTPPPIGHLLSYVGTCFPMVPSTLLPSSLWKTYCTSPICVAQCDYVTKACLSH